MRTRIAFNKTTISAGHGDIVRAELSLVCQDTKLAIDEQIHLIAMLSVSSLILSDDNGKLSIDVVPKRELSCQS